MKIDTCQRFLLENCCPAEHEAQMAFQPELGSGNPRMPRLDISRVAATTSILISFDGNGDTESESMKHKDSSDSYWLVSLTVVV